MYLALRALELMVPGDFPFSLMMLCYCVLHVLRHFVHWNCCSQGMCSRVVCCHSIVFCDSVSADRSGVAALGFIVAARVVYLFTNVLVWGSSSYNVVTFWLKLVFHALFGF